MSVAERRQREREERRQHILTAAARVFYDQGLEAATMDDVAAKAQLGKGTLYLYFRTKEELLLGLAVRKQLAMLARFDEEERAASDGRDRVRRFLLAFATELATPREHLRMVMSRWTSGARLGDGCECAAQAHDNMRRMFARMCEAIRRGQADGSIRTDYAPERLALQLHCAVSGALLAELKLAVLPLAELAAHAPTVEEQIDLVLEAIRPREDAVPRASRPRRAQAARRQP